VTGTGSARAGAAGVSADAGGPYTFNSDSDPAAAENGGGDAAHPASPTAKAMAAEKARAVLAWGCKDVAETRGLLALCTGRSLARTTARSAGCHVCGAVPVDAGHQPGYPARPTAQHRHWGEPLPCTARDARSVDFRTGPRRATTTHRHPVALLPRRPSPRHHPATQRTAHLQSAKSKCKGPSMLRQLGRPRRAAALDGGCTAWRRRSRHCPCYFKMMTCSGC